MGCDGGRLAGGSSGMPDPPLQAYDRLLDSLTAELDRCRQHQLVDRYSTLGRFRREQMADAIVRLRREIRQTLHEKVRRDLERLAS